MRQGRWGRRPHRFLRLFCSTGGATSRCCCTKPSSTGSRLSVGCGAAAPGEPSWAPKDSLRNNPPSTAEQPPPQGVTWPLCLAFSFTVRCLQLHKELERSACGSVLFEGYLPPPSGRVQPLEVWAAAVSLRPLSSLALFSCSVSCQAVEPPQHHGGTVGCPVRQPPSAPEQHHASQPWHRRASGESGGEEHGSRWVSGRERWKQTWEVEEGAWGAALLLLQGLWCLVLQLG